MARLTCMTVICICYSVFKKSIEKVFYQFIDNLPRKEGGRELWVLWNLLSFLRILKWNKEWRQKGRKTQPRALKSISYWEIFFIWNGDLILMQDQWKGPCVQSDYFKFTQTKSTLTVYCTFLNKEHRLLLKNIDMFLPTFGITTCLL